jgi:hypothetical protein
VVVIETVPHHSQNRGARSAREPRGLGDIAVFNRGEHFLDTFGIAPKPAAAPPEDSLDHNREADDRHDQNGPHNGATLAELVDQPIAAEHPTAGFLFGSWRRALSGGRCGA